MTTAVHTIDGKLIAIGDRVWYEGHKNVHRNNNDAGPGWRDNPAMQVTVIKHTPAASERANGSIIIRFDTPMVEHFYPRKSVATEEIDIGVFRVGSKFFAGHHSSYNFDGFVEPCNFFGLYSSKAAVRTTKWPKV